MQVDINITNVTPKPLAIPSSQGTINVIDGNKKVSISIADIPAISVITTVILKKTDGNVFNNIPATSLEFRAKNVLDSAKELKDAQDHSNWHKILCLLKTTLIVGVIVGGILGSIALASAGFGAAPAFLAVGTFFVSALLGTVYGMSIGVDLTKAAYLMPIAAVIGGPFFPIYEAFTHTSTLKEKFKTDQDSFKIDFDQINTVFSKDLSSIEQALKEKIKAIELDITKANEISKLECSALSHLQSSALQEFEQTKRNYEIALQELMNAKSFYSKFNVTE